MALRCIGSLRWVLLCVPITGCVVEKGNTSSSTPSPSFSPIATKIPLTAPLSLPPSPSPPGVDNSHRFCYLLYQP